MTGRDEWDWSAPFQEGFVSAAAVREVTGHVRIAQARRISSAHLSAQCWRARPAGARSRRGGRARGRGQAPWRGRAVAAAVVGLLAAGLALSPGLRASLAAQPWNSTAGLGDGTPRVPRPADASSSRLLPAVDAPAGAGGFAFLLERRGRPVAFDPCRPVHWVMRSRGAPADGPQLLGDAFAELSRATGLAFVFDGLTGEGLNDRRPLVDRARYGPRYSPVLVAWSDPAESPDLQGGVAGFAGPLLADPDGRGPRLVTGTVVLDAPQVARLQGAYAARLSVVLHELGHLAGLAHVDDPRDTMYARSAVAGGYTVGARRGLSQVGQGRCFTDWEA